MDFKRALGFFVAYLVCLQAEAASVHFRVVAQSGKQAPGLPDGVTFRGFELPRMNDTGQVVFYSGLSEPGIVPTSNGSLWSESNGQLHLVAQSGAIAPGTESGVSFSSFLIGPGINNDGTTPFRASLKGNVDATNDSGIWIDSGGGAALFLREGSAAPGMGDGIIIGSPGYPTTANSAATIFNATLSGTGIDSSNNFAIWSNSDGNLHPVIRSGAQAPGTSPGTVFKAMSSANLVAAIDEQGNFGFYGKLTGAGVDPTNDSGLWQEQNENLNLLAREGNHAPNTEDGVLFGEITGTYRSGPGKLPILATLTGPGVTAANALGIWSQAGGSLHLVARNGFPVPGGGPGETFSGIGVIFPPEFNNGGEVAFLTRTAIPGTSSSTDVIWSEGGGVLHMVAQTGMPAPGTPVGTVFSNLGYSYGDPVINDLGKVAFTGFLASGGQGIWAEGPGGLQLVIQTGQQIQLDNGTTGIVTGFDFYRSSDPLTYTNPRGKVFNRNNQIALWVNVNNQTDVLLVADLSIPEPSTLLLLLVGIAVAERFWRQRAGSRHRRQRRFA